MEEFNAGRILCFRYRRAYLTCYSESCSTVFRMRPVRITIKITWRYDGCLLEARRYCFVWLLPQTTATVRESRHEKEQRRISYNFMTSYTFLQYSFVKARAWLWKVLYIHCWWQLISRDVVLGTCTCNLMIVALATSLLMIVLPHDAALLYEK